ncbi:solute carrier family 22 member 3-like [Condylostylus longicornis]|uniref:solute carrier family 22 member 3-like n=1 Tax=Condylostylus longicornis TaxID=2530218 RepID=UPI00244E0CAA|nr:solute carrier family 22 member 3-like [Condylostylus longicornis]
MTSIDINSKDTVRKPKLKKKHEYSKDIISEINGDFGRWQLRTILLIFLCKIPSSWFMACIIFTAPSPKYGKYYCKPPENVQINDTKTWIHITHPIITEEIKADRQFDMDFYSLITEFDLVCSRQLLISVTQSFHSLGTFLGGLISKYILEKLSPKRVMILGMICQIICGNLTGLVNTFMLHIFFRCLTAIFCGFMISAGEVIIQDITNGKARTIIITLFQLYWSIGLILLPGISIFFDSWAILYISISSPTILLLILCR